ncbi:MAG: YafY family transcriptional regulator [Paucibacter sp.]|nr:YafY family transcriptional regulator [Roseateles sp.]
MRRADRLFQLVQLIRGRRLSTADYLAARLEVSPRTVYRDVAALQAQGVPIEGEAGVGYRMKAGFDLAPLMFGKREAQALVAAIRMSEPSLDSGLAEAAEMALGKILAVLPADARAAAESLALFAPLSRITPELSERLALARQATESRHKLRLGYLSLEGEHSDRIVRPLACFFWGPVWTLAAWCELREDFRSFRVDRIESLEVLEVRFRDEAGKTLADMNRDRG